jgi:hypothetical protein
MAAATIRLVSDECMSEFFFKDNQVALAQRLLTQGQYRTVGTMGVPGLNAEDAAEEVFDLTNNPSRQTEREDLYGRGRSVSVGDIVNVDGVDYLCASMGWIELSHNSVDQ